MTAKDVRASELFDLFVGAPQGLTVDDVMQATGWTIPTFNETVRHLRSTLSANDDTVFVVADPQGQGERWLYRLVDGSSLIDEEDTRWVENRLGDAESRVTSLLTAMKVAVAATDGRTVPGRKARTLERGFRHMVEDLEGLVEA